MRKSVAIVIATLFLWLPIVANNSLIRQEGLLAIFYTLFAILLATAIYQLFRHSPSAPITLRLAGSLALLGFVPITFVMLWKFDTHPIEGMSIPLLRGHLLLGSVLGLLMVAFSHMESVLEHTHDHAQLH